MYRTAIGHVKLKVRELDRAIDFYSRFLNLRLVERVESQRHAFLSAGNSHHEIALEGIEPAAPGPQHEGTGLHHVAFQVPDKKAFAQAFKTLTEAGVRVTTSDNRISWSIYFDDPDGNGIEIYCDTRGEPDGQPFWAGIRDPLGPEKILAGLASGS